MKNELTAIHLGGGTSPLIYESRGFGAHHNIQYTSAHQDLDWPIQDL